MARSPKWFQQVADAIAALRASSVPVIDRDGIERLLGVSRRDAIRLLHRFGGYQAGRTFLIDKEQLIIALEAVHRGEDFGRESRRRERLAEKLEGASRELQARQVKLPVAREHQSNSSLPFGIHIRRPGILEVEFRSSEELLGRLFELVQIAGRNFEEFRRLIDST